MLKIVEVYSNVLVLINQVAALNWSDTIYSNLGYPAKNAENRHFFSKSDLKVLYPLVMFLKLMLKIVEVFGNVLALISQVAALNWSVTYNHLGYPVKLAENRHLSESALSISDVPETYSQNSWGL